MRRNTMPIIDGRAYFMALSRRTPPQREIQVPAKPCV